MLKCFDLTENDLARIKAIKAEIGAGSAREVVRRALEEYHKKIFTPASPLGENNRKPAAEQQNS